MSVATKEEKTEGKVVAVGSGKVLESGKVQPIEVKKGDRVIFGKYAGDEVTMDLLREKDLAKSRYDILKILGDGELTKKLKVCGHRFSTSAREKIEKAGGEVVVLPGKTTVEQKKKHAKSSRLRQASVDG